MTEAEKLLEKYRLGKCTPEELLLLQKWFHGLGLDEPSELTETDLVSARQAIGEQAARLTSKTRNIHRWPRVAAAACIILCLSIGGYYLVHKKQAVSQLAQNQKHDIAPGGNKAILTLAGG